MMQPSARSVAAHVIMRVQRDQAFASAALDSELQRQVQLPERDRRLATELVYGVLRTARYLDSRLSAFAKRGLGSLDPDTRAHLLVAAYQIVCLQRVPAFAAVSEAVALVRKRRGPQLASFTNAVLRKLADEVSRDGQVPLANATQAALDPWLLQQLTASLGSHDEALSMVSAGPWPPPMGLRVRPGDDRDVWIARMREALPEASVQPGTTSPLCITVRGAGKPQQLAGYDSGAWIVQEEGSQVLALLLGVRPGERVLDACAGRGNKASLLALQAGPNGQVDAADLHEAKLRVLRESFESMGLKLGEAYAVDWSVGPGDVPQTYDRVLVDAPCSGVGTLRRRPDLGQRDLRSRVRELSGLQEAILRTAALRCRPGGRVLYAVCSVLRQEAEEVVEKVLAKEPSLVPAPFDSKLGVQLAGQQCSVRLLPSRHGTDGYFVMSLRREQSDAGALSHPR